MNFFRYYLYLPVIFLIGSSPLYAGEKHDRTDPLAPDSIRMEIWGEAIEVKGQSNETGIGMTGSQITIAPANVSKLPSMLGGTDLLKVLELTPGVRNPGDANTNIYIRGGDAGQNLLLYNGVSLYTPGHLLGLFPLFNSDHISTVGLNKTGIHAKYGGRLSSVIHVESKSVLPDRTSFTGNVGVLASQATLAIPVGERFGLYLSGRKTYLNLFLQPALDATVNNKNTGNIEGAGYDFYDTNITLVGELSDKNKIIVNAFLGSDDLQITEKELYLSGKLDWSNRMLSLQWDTRVNDQPFSQQIYGSAYKNKLNITQTETSLYLSSAIQDAGYQNSYTFSIAGIPVEAGMQYTFHEITPQVYSMTNMGQELYTETSFVQKAHDAGLYIHSSIPLASRLRAELGLRYNIFYHDKLFCNLDPRIVLRYWTLNQLSLRFAYSRQHQYLNLLTPSSIGIPTDFWIAVSDDIPPQSGDEFSAGYSQSFFNADFDVSAEIYYRNMNNLTEYSQNFLNGQGDSYINNVLLGRGRAYGLEVMLKKNRGKLTGWISYALGRSERNFDEINNGKTFPARFDRRHDLSVVGAYTINSKWDVSSVYAFATGGAYTLPSSWYLINNSPVREYGDYNAARMPNYNRMDLSVNYWFKRDRNGINFSVYNLFMVKNPIYVFLSVGKDEETGEMAIRIRQRTLYRIVPSISWRFRF
jgi:hypothetical protein